MLRQLNTSTFATCQHNLCASELHNVCAYEHIYICIVLLYICMLALLYTQKAQGRREGVSMGSGNPFQLSTHYKFPPIMMHAHGYNL